MADPLNAPWMHDVDRAEAERRLQAASGRDGLFLVRPKGQSYAISIMIKGRAVHRLIEQRTAGVFTVDRISGDWGNELADVVEAISSEVRAKHNINNITHVERPDTLTLR